MKSKEEQCLFSFVLVEHDSHTVHVGRATLCIARHVSVEEKIARDCCYTQCGSAGFHCDFLPTI